MEKTAASEIANLTDTRSLDDRRVFSWRTVLFGFLRSRRRNHRRLDEDEPVFTDWHHPWLFAMSVGIMILSSMDAFFTLRLIGRGATEVNPVMALLLGQGTLAFAASKMLLTGASILVLVFLAKAQVFSRFRSGMALTAVFCMYCCLICYEFILLLSGR